MEKPIFENEEEARDFYDELLVPDLDPNRKRSFLFNAKTAGYIKKSIF